MLLAYIIAFTSLGSIASLGGSFFLLAKKQITESFATKLISFAAGALIGVAFLDLLPEAQEVAKGANIFIPAILGFISFFFIERFIRLSHHHHGHGERPTVQLILIGDGVHNFIDGIIIAAAFLTDIRLGIVTSLAVAAHEVPQEIADMGVLLACGISKRRAVFYNVLSALTALVGAVITFFFSSFVLQYLYVFLALAAGHFIYISASDLIPQLHEKIDGGRYSQAFIFLFGIIAIYTFTIIFEG